MEFPHCKTETLYALCRKYFPFETYNAGQDDAIVSAVRGILLGYKHIVLDAPTGVGKSAIALTVHSIITHLVPWNRTTIATPRIALQDVYVKSSPLVYDLRSKLNYDCPHGAEHFDTMACKKLRYKEECSPMAQCPYVSRRYHWCNTAQLRTTNHSFLLEACGRIVGQPQNRTPFIILDECHNLSTQIVEHSHVTFSLKDVKVLAEHDIGNHGAMAHFLGELLEASPQKQDKIFAIDERLRDILKKLMVYSSSLYDEIDEYVKFKVATDGDIPPKLSAALEDVNNVRENCELMLSAPGRAEFIVEKVSNEAISFKPLHASYTSQYCLFRKGDYFLHMSATICGFNAYCESIGIDHQKDKEVYRVNIESPFKKENRPVYIRPIAKFSHGTKDEALRKIAAHLDVILDKHANDRGIVHTVSYSNAEYIEQHTKHPERLIMLKDPNEALEYLETSTNGVVLTPAMEEGYDLIGDMSRFQVLIKIPYGYLGDPIIAHMSEKFPLQYQRNTVMRLVQAAGRSIRSVDDYAATYILDSNFNQLYTRNGWIFPTWFRQAVING